MSLPATLFSIKTLALTNIFKDKNITPFYYKCNYTYMIIIIIIATTQYTNPINLCMLDPVIFQ